VALEEAVVVADVDNRLLDRVDVDASHVDSCGCADVRGEVALGVTTEPLAPGVERDSLGVAVGVRSWRDELEAAALPEVVDVHPWWRLGVTVALAALHRSQQPLPSRSRDRGGRGS
jgi:hypothetical protein